jgi:hypothetical protein
MSCPNRRENPRLHPSRRVRPCQKTRQEPSPAKNRVSERSSASSVWMDVAQQFWVCASPPAALPARICGPWPSCASISLPASLRRPSLARSFGPWQKPSGRSASLPTAWVLSSWRALRGSPFALWSPTTTLPPSQRCRRSQPFPSLPRSPLPPHPIQLLPYPRWRLLPSR